MTRHGWTYWWTVSAAISIAAWVGLCAPAANAQLYSRQLYGQPSRAFAAADSSARVQQVCVGDALGEARNCALAKCRKAGGRDCRVMAACDRADWSGTISVALQGSRFALTICGVPSRPGLVARMKDLCRGYRARGLETCTLETVWTPAGVEEIAGLRWTRQALGGGRSAAR